jgi:glycosyltransferase involved in cell wall biosynthesis
MLVGWVGTPGNLGYLDPLSGVFARLRQAGVAELEVVCTRPWSGPARFRRWLLAEEAEVFARYDVGIMPLPDLPFTRAKAGFKLLQSLASAVPVVASPVGVNRFLLEESGGGILASTPDEWERALRQLAARPELRAELGARGRRFVASYADLDAQADTLAALLSRSRAPRSSSYSAR